MLEAPLEYKFVWKFVEVSTALEAATIFSPKTLERLEISEIMSEIHPSNRVGSRAQGT